MLLRTREPSLGLWTGVDTTEIARTSRLVARLTGYQVQPNKAIVGRNAFAHEAGIHQDGVLKERETYEIMDATTVGLQSNSIVLGKHSGRHALHKALEEMGFELDGQALNTAFRRFKEIADRKKHVTAMDLEALVTDELREEIPGYALEWFEVEASSRRAAHARVSVTLPDDSSAQGTFTGDGPIDAVFQAIDAAAGVGAKLNDFTIGAVTEGQDALGEVSVVVEVNGSTGAGQGVSTDIIDAAARAYVRALSSPSHGRARVRPSACPRRPARESFDDLAAGPSSPQAGGRGPGPRSTAVLTLGRPALGPRGGRPRGRGAYASASITSVSGRTPSNVTASAAASDCMNCSKVAMSGTSASIRPDRALGSRNVRTVISNGRTPPRASVSRPSARRRQPRGIRSALPLLLDLSRPRP